jgi:thiol-disulfide isomerase/thioredoxin
MNARRRTTACILLVIAIGGCVDLHLFSRSVKNNVGQTLPDLELNYLDQKPDLKGKALILEFWATWCEPCRDGIPILNETYKTYKDQGLEIVGITKDDAATVRGFSKEIPIKFPVALDPTNSVAGLLGITIIPHTIIVNRSGRITWEGTPATMQPGDVETALK